MSDDPYVYPGTEPPVLKNRLDIRDRDTLEKAERYAVKNGREIETKPAFVASTPNEKAFRDIHKALFGEIYEWAGKTRTVDIAKGNSYFCRAAYVDKYLAERFAALAGERHLKGLDAPKFAERAAEHICEINAAHPFREGNGRTTLVFLHKLARHAGHEFDLGKIDREKWIAASIAGMNGDYTLMRQVIAEALTPGRNIARERAAVRRGDPERSR